jgi:hypothetical protein
LLEGSNQGCSTAAQFHRGRITVPAVKVYWRVPTLRPDHQAALQPGLPPLLQPLITRCTSPATVELPASNPLISVDPLSKVSVPPAICRSQGAPEYRVRAVTLVNEEHCCR